LCCGHNSKPYGGIDFDGVLATSRKVPNSTFPPRHQIVHWGDNDGVPNTIFLGQKTPSTKTTMLMQRGG